MEVLVAERSRTQSAFLAGGEFAEYGSRLASFDHLCDFIASRQCDDRIVMTTMEEKDNEVVIKFFNRVGIDTSQLSICFNENDREELVSELSRFCQPAPTGT